MSHTRIGKVVSVGAKNTLNVLIEDKLRHPTYQKVISRSKKIKAHVNDGEKVVLGDMVEIKSCRPISKTKHFEFVRVIEVK
ncbi:MAG: 30S ribosomal protein S17 [Patescibacteria group bacterium]